MVKRVLLLDPLKDGHRVQNVLSLAEAARRHPDLHLMFLVHPWVKEHLASRSFPGQDRVELIGLGEADVAGLTSNNRQPFKSLRVLRIAEEISRRNSVDHVHMMNIDIFLLSAPLFLVGRHRQSWSGLLFCPAIHYGKIYGNRLTLRRRVHEIVKHALVRMLLGNPRFRLLQVDDPGYVEYVASEKVKLVPEHAQDTDSETPPADLDPRWLDLPHRILCFGALSRRHGIFELCYALARLDIEPNSVGIVFAGNTVERDRAQFRETLSELTTRQPNLQICYLERYVADSEVKWLFNRCSVVAIPYQSALGSSSVICWAARAGRPVVAQDWGLIGHVVAENGLGVTVNTADPEAIAQGLRRAMGGAIFDGPKVRAFAERNTASNFAESYLNQLKSVMYGRDTRC